MKKLAVMAVVAGVAVASQADFFINYGSSYGIADNSEAIGILNGAVGPTATVELYYVGDNGDFDTLAGTGVLGDVLPGGVGDDVLLWSGDIMLGDVGSEWADGTYNGSVIAAGAGGDIFGRIWNQSQMKYYQGDIMTASNLDPGGSPPPTPELYDLGAGAFAAATSGNVIPEPATIGLMGIAGLGMFLARRKSRR